MSVDNLMRELNVALFHLRRDDHLGQSGRHITNEIIAHLEQAMEPLGGMGRGRPNNGLDTDSLVRFYEHDFYPLSNFSAFTLIWQGNWFDTSEAAYHWEKFPDRPDLQRQILEAPSAHVAFKLAEEWKAARTIHWDEIKLDVMRAILRAKVDQHEYVRRKLLATGDRRLVEDSWRDDFWGWGPYRDGQNWLGRIWMEIRDELRGAGGDA